MSDGALGGHGARLANTTPKVPVQTPVVVAEQVVSDSPDAPGDAVVVVAQVVPTRPDASPLKVGQAVAVTKAGGWIIGEEGVNESAKIKKVNKDGTYDVAVFRRFAGDLKEEYVLTNKPYPNEVSICLPAALSFSSYHTPLDIAPTGMLR